MLLRADRVFTGHERHSPGLIEIAAGRVVRAGPVVPAHDHGSPIVDLGEVTVVPGFVDVHCHGGFGAAAAEDPLKVAGFHRDHGTTTLVASLVTQDLAIIREQVARLALFVAAGEVAGVHLEGPWLSEQYRGAHPAQWLQDPDVTEIAAVLDAGAGVRMVTIAPERTGGLDAIRMLTGRGIVAAIGHTAATFAQARDAIAAGATGATHLFNAMPPLAHRAPGPVLALLADDRVFLELVVDGVHLDLALVVWVAGQYPARVVFVTDAMAAAGQPDGTYRLGDLPVEVLDGIARVAGTGTIAGSTLTLERAVRTAIAAGVPWETAVRAATLTPARYLNLPDVGELRPGAWADLVVLDREWAVQRVMRHGDWIV